MEGHHLPSGLEHSMQVGEVERNQALQVLHVSALTALRAGKWLCGFVECQVVPDTLEIHSISGCKVVAGERWGRDQL